MEPSRDLDDLKRALELLAAPAGEQVDYLHELGTYPSLDELALEFDDAVAPIRHELGESRVLRELDEVLDRMSGHPNAGLWEAESLDGDEWNQVRALAASALASLLE